MHSFNPNDVENVDSLYYAIKNGKNNFFEIDEFDLIDLFSNKLKPELEESFSMHYCGVDYKKNKRQYRSPEFKIGTDVLALGCSFTAGTGIQNDEYVWPAYFSKNVNLNYANIAHPGDSVGGQIRKAFAYFKEYGHPKYIYAVFPNFMRFEIVENEKLFIKSKEFVVDKNKKNVKNLYDNDLIKTTVGLASYMQPKYSKQPHVAEEILPEDFIFFKNIQLLLIFQQYCEAVGIRFAWSCWDQNVFDTINTINIDESLYKNLINIKMKNWKFDEKNIIDFYYEDEDKKNLIKCHTEHSKIPEFELGLDRCFGNTVAHWGAHRHIHIAEEFVKHFNEKYN